MVNNSNEIELNKQKIEENQPKLEEKEKSKEKQILIGSGKPVGVFELYFKFANKTDIILIILAMIGSVGSGLSMPIFSLLFGSTISFIGPTNSLEEITDSINNILIRFSIVACAMFCAYFMNSSFWIYTSTKNLAALKREYFKVIMRQEQGWFDQNNPYQFSTMVQSQLKTIESGIGDKLGNVLMAVSMFFSGIIIAMTTSWKLTLILVAMMPLMTIGAVIMGKAIMEGAKDAENAYTKAGGVSEEVLYQIKTVASFSNFYYEIDKFNKYVKECRDIGIKNSKKSAFGLCLVFVVLYCTYCMAIWYGSVLITNKEYNSQTGKLFGGGDILTVIISVIMAGISLGNAAPNFKLIRQAQIAASDFFELSERVHQIDMSKSTKKPEREYIKGNIEIKNIRFSYPKDPQKEILKGINFNFPAGKKVAIVGESGSGKSTIVNLLERLYDTNSGQILIDDIDIKEYDLPYLRSCIGFVQQEPVLFNKSIRENIIFGRENVTDELILEALKESLANEFVDQIKEGLDFKVGIKGKNLSGGQKQRLAIARAILNKPKILILDEATSALDNKNERLVQLSLDRVSRNVTTVVIAHRLTTIINSDIIIAMKNGEILETGTHDELLNKNGYYFALFKSQTNEKDDKKINEINITNNNSIYENASNADGKTKIEEKVNNNLNENNPIININEKLHLKNNEEDLSDEMIALKQKELEERVKKSKGKLFHYLKDSKGTMLIASFSAACSGAIFPCYGLLLAYSIDALSSPNMEIVKNDGFFMAMMFLIVAALAGMTMFFQNFLFGKIGETLSQNLRTAVFFKFLQMHIGFFDKPENAPGSLMTRLSSDTTKLNGIVLTIIGVTVQSFTNLVLGLVLGFVYDWRLSLISVAFMPLVAFSGALQNELRKGLIKSDEKLDIESGAILSEAVINTKTIFSYNMQGKISDYYNELIMSGKQNIVKSSFIAGLSFGFSQFVIFITYAVVFYCGGRFIMAGTLTFGNMMKAMFSILFAAFGLGQAQQYVGDISKAKLAIDSIFQILDSESTINPLDDNEKFKKSADELKGKIEFRNVTFSYPTRTDTVVLKNISFVILPGQNVAFTGFSGSGKSTIIQLIERFYDVQTGEILIDDVNIKEYSICSLRKRIGIVMQEPNIFKRNVKENIEYGKLGANYEEIVSSAEKAMIGEFFKNGEKGEKDDNVSGGQKQRISIARAILKDPRILLLDEATSALDKNSETEVQKAIENASENRTTVTIAHRLSTIQNCDLIFVLNQGEIVEKGTHMELIELKGFYAKQYNVSK
jgi:ATP-binding cassette subfamily B (MDR/TAP) protein 1